MKKRNMEVHHPAKLVRILARGGPYHTMKKAAAIVGACTSASEAATALGHSRRNAVLSLVPDDAHLAPAIVGVVGGVNINASGPEACCTDDCCTGLGGCCTH